MGKLAIGTEWKDITIDDLEVGQIWIGSNSGFIIDSVGVIENRLIFYYIVDINNSLPWIMCTYMELTWTEIPTLFANAGEYYSELKPNKKHIQQINFDREDPEDHNNIDYDRAFDILKDICGG